MGLIFERFEKISKKKSNDHVRKMVRFLTVNSKDLFLHHEENNFIGTAHESRLYVAKDENIAITHNVKKHMRHDTLNFQIFDFDKQKKAMLWKEDGKFSFAKGKISDSLKTIDLSSTVYSRMLDERDKEDHSRLGEHAYPAEHTDYIYRQSHVPFRHQDLEHSDKKIDVKSLQLVF